MVQSIHLPLHDEIMPDANGPPPIIVEQQKLAQSVAKFVSAFCKKNPDYFIDIKVRRAHALVDLERYGPKLPGRTRQAQEFYIHINENIHSLPATGESASVIIRFKVISAQGDTSSLPQPTEAALVSTISTEGISRRFIKPVSTQEAPLEDIDITFGLMMVIQTFNPLMTPFKDNRMIGMGAAATIYGERAVDKDLGGDDAPQELDVTLPPGQVSPSQHTYVPVYPGEETPNLNDPSASAASVAGSELAEKREWQAEQHRPNSHLAKAIAGGIALHEIEALDHKQADHARAHPAAGHQTQGAKDEIEGKDQAAENEGGEAPSEMREGELTAQETAAEVDRLDENIGSPEGELEQNTLETSGLSAAELEASEAPTRPETAGGETSLIDTNNKGDDSTSDMNQVVDAEVSETDENAFAHSGDREKGVTEGPAAAQAAKMGTAPDASEANGQELEEPAHTEDVVSQEQAFDKALNVSSSYAEASRAEDASDNANLAVDRATEATGQETPSVKEGPENSSLTESDAEATPNQEEETSIEGARSETSLGHQDSSMSGASGTPEEAREAFAKQAEEFAEHNNENNNETPSVEEIKDKFDQLDEQMKPPEVSTTIESSPVNEETTGEAAARRAEARVSMTKEETSAVEAGAEDVGTPSADARGQEAVSAKFKNVNTGQGHTEERAHNEEVHGAQAEALGDYNNKKNESSSGGSEIREHLDQINDVIGKPEKNTNDAPKPGKNAESDHLPNDEKTEVSRSEPMASSELKNKAQNIDDKAPTPHETKEQRGESIHSGSGQEMSPEESQDYSHATYAREGRPIKESVGRLTEYGDSPASGDRSHAEIDFSRELERARHIVEQKEANRDEDAAGHALLEAVHHGADIAAPLMPFPSETTRTALLGTAVGVAAYAAGTGAAKQSPSGSKLLSPKAVPTYARRAPNQAGISKVSKKVAYAGVGKVSVKKAQKRVGEKKIAKAEPKPPSPSSDPAPNP